MNYAPNLRLTGHNNTNLTRTIQNWKIWTICSHENIRKSPNQPTVVTSNQARQVLKLTP